MEVRGRQLSCHCHAPCSLDTGHGGQVEWHCGGSNHLLVTASIGGGGDSLVVTHLAVRVGDCCCCCVGCCTLAVVSTGSPTIIAERTKEKTHCKVEDLVAA